MRILVLFIRYFLVGMLKKLKYGDFVKENSSLGLPIHTWL